MCGLAGQFCPPDSAATLADAGLLARMGDAIAHRGPDDSGVWLDRDAGIGFVHRRLAIVDLSPAGHQPMVSPAGRYVIVFNGEIYNHAKLRDELERSGSAPAWRGHSDTETLLAGFEAWGVAGTLRKCIGMFAVALWDRRDRRLTLARDRLGEKPLYYGRFGGSFFFSSELKALRAHPRFEVGIDRDALALLMRHNYIPAPHSIYRGIHKLLPGTLLELGAADQQPRITSYWQPGTAIERSQSDPFTGSAQDAVDALETLLKDAVAQQMMADVPLGAFLSGGVDSSTIVALMQAQSSRRVRTFSIGFHEDEFNEAQHAKAVAQHLGTDHTEMYVTAQDALDVIPRLPQLYDEPYADSSQLPTFLVSQIARRHVTVSLSGDAGDELFCGYTRYLLGDRAWRRLSRIPMALRRPMAAALTGLSPATWNRLSAPVQGLLPRRLRTLNIGDKLHKGAGVLASRSSAELYRSLVSHWNDPSAIVLGGREPETVLTRVSEQPRTGSDVERMMALDLMSYLPDDILCKVDRAAMGVSLETRVPFLDHRVVEFAWRLPFAYKLRDGVGKWVLREVLYRHVPRALIERPKMGFGVPIDRWLRGPLRDWAEALLDPARLRREGFFDPAPIRRRWAEHLSGNRNWQYHLWDVLSFQAWYEANP